MDYVDVSADVKSVEETAGAFSRKAEQLTQLVTDKREALVAARQSDIDRAGVVETDGNGNKVVDKDLRKAELTRIERNIAAELREFRSTLMESSAKERTAVLNQLLKKGERLEQLEQTFPNSASFLSRAGLGSTERTNLAATLAHAGKAALGNYAQQAMLSGNRILAAAVVERLEALPARERPMKASEVAEAMVGDEYKQWIKSIADARDAIKAAMELDDLLVSGNESPTTRIERGLRTRAANRRAA